MLVYLSMIELDDNRSKFVEIYETYRGLMFYTAMQILDKKEDAEDAVHQAFVSILENLYKISQVKCPKTRAYVVIITERKALDILRQKTKVDPEAFDESGFGTSFALPGDGGLADAIAELPGAYREMILLRYYHGYSVREIADMLGISKAAAQKTLWRAKHRLDEALNGGGTP